MKRTVIRPAGFLARGQRGLSMVEMVMSVAIGALLIALALPLYQGFIRDRWVERVAQDIAGLLRSAQQSAIGDSIDGCYRVQVRATGAVIERVARDLPTRACTWTGPSVLRATDAFPADATVAVATVEFTPAGGVAGGSALSIAISYGDRTRTVNLQAQTGRVQITP